MQAHRCSTLASVAGRCRPLAGPLPSGSLHARALPKAIPLPHGGSRHVCGGPQSRSEISRSLCKQLKGRRFTTCSAATVDQPQGGDAGHLSDLGAKQPTSLVGGILTFFGNVLWRSWQLGVLAVYAGFWLALTNMLWFSTGYSNIVWLVPVLWLFISDWALLKMLTVVWLADTLNAWPFVVVKLLFDFIQNQHRASVNSFPRSMRVLGAMLGRDLCAPVLANLRILHYTPREAGLLGPLTEPLADSSDTTVYKWSSLYDIAWGVVILWFVYCHFMMYEQYWGTWFPFGKGFNWGEMLGSWHMPQIPTNWRPDISSGPIQIMSHTVQPWGPYI